MQRSGRWRKLKESLRGIVARLKCAVMRLLMGRRFMRSLEQNRDAAERLDQALREMLQR